MLKRIIPMTIGFVIVPVVLFAAELRSPTTDQTISAFIARFLQAIVLIAMPIIALFVVYAGFKYIVARGNPGKIEEAHTNFLYVVIGAMLILGAAILAKLIAGTVGQLMTAT